MRRIKISAIPIILAVTCSSFAYSMPSRLNISAPRKPDAQLTLPPPIESAESPPPTKAEYETRAAYLQGLKIEILQCLCSIELGQELLDVLIAEELPHRAFAIASHQFGETFTSVFGDHPNLVRRDGEGRLRLTRDGLAAWVYFHADIAGA
jgi:hypothetical protein